MTAKHDLRDHRTVRLHVVAGQTRRVSLAEHLGDDGGSPTNRLIGLDLGLDAAVAEATPGHDRLLDRCLGFVDTVALDTELMHGDSISGSDAGDGSSVDLLAIVPRGHDFMAARTFDVTEDLVGRALAPFLGEGLDDLCSMTFDAASCRRACLYGF